MSKHFSKFKALVNELMNFKSIPNYTCEGLKTLQVIWKGIRLWKFLWIFHDSYKDLKAHILLIMPFPSCNEVYLNIQQKEKIRQISVDASTSEIVTLTSHEKYMWSTCSTRYQDILMRGVSKHVCTVRCLGAQYKNALGYMDTLQIIKLMVKSEKIEALLIKTLPSVV